MKQTMMMTYDLKGPGGVSVTASAFAGEGMLQSLGLELQQGRDFVASDYTDLDLSSRNGPTDTGAPTPLILTAALARQLFPEGGALCGHLRHADSGASTRYVAIWIVRHLLRHQVGEPADGTADKPLPVPTRPPA